MGHMNHKKTNKNILSPKDFIKRLFKYFLIAFGLIMISLYIGIAGYHYIAGLGWLDSFYNASMILTGMGPVNIMETGMAKFFSSCYALFSGIVFLTTVGIFFAPIAHRLKHLLHVDPDDDDDKKE
jgi:hypothetical protein